MGKSIKKPCPTVNGWLAPDGKFIYETIFTLSELEEKFGKLSASKDDQKGVQPLNEMVDMMQTMQLFESQQKAMRTTDELLGKITSQLGRY